jgi:hypothetical protein
MCMAIYISLTLKQYFTTYTVYLHTLICQIKKEYDESLDYLLTYVKLEINLWWIMSIAYHITQQY